MKRRNQNFAHVGLIVIPVGHTFRTLAYHGDTCPIALIRQALKTESEYTRE